MSDVVIREVGYRNPTCAQTAFLLSCPVGHKRRLDLLQVKHRIYMVTLTPVGYFSC